jgi:hypothetical protein
LYSKTGMNEVYRTIPAPSTLRVMTHRGHCRSGHAAVFKPYTGFRSINGALRTFRA